MFSRKKRTLWILWILALPLTTQCACPNEFQDTGQSDWPPVEWNDEAISGGGTLYYCPGRINCKLKCMADSDFSPSFYFNGQCLAVTEVSEAIPGATVVTNHPQYTLEYHCASGVELRCVNGENRYSPGYTSEFKSAELCGLMPGLLPANTDSPGSIPSNTTVTNDDPQSVLLPSVLVGSVGVAVMVMVVSISALVCAIRRRSRFIAGPVSCDINMAADLENHFSEVTSVDSSNVTGVANGSSATLEWVSGAFSVGDNASEQLQMDTSSSITVVAVDPDSEARDLPDGGVEDIPFSVQLEDETGLAEFVPGIPEY